VPDHIWQGSHRSEDLCVQDGICRTRFGFDRFRLATK
jgi:hypothetical protein